ncbi:MAG: polyribonucleotide nucleotidyltransferase [Anaerolineae bacterium]|nr:polyribonucleotide nucleotidyltransferase [Anaerolineae bacterium]
MSHQFSAAIGKYSISFETGKLAQQAGGAVTVSCGDTMLLTTATMSRTPRENVNFFPLTVDYEERLYAAGRIPGSFFRREGRPHEGAILTCRLVDRPIRPLFPKDLRNDVQVIVTALSHDQEHQIDILAILGASAALTISDIPFGGPIGAVRVGYVDGEFIFNPTFSEMERSTLDLRLAGTADAVLMVEAGANEVSEDLVVAAIKAGHEAMQPIIALQEEMRRAVGKPKRTYTSFAVGEDVKAAVAAQLGDRLRQLLIENPIKSERNEALDALQDEVIAALSEQYAASDIKAMFHELLRDEVRRRIMEEGVRPDGRDFTTIRPISCETHLLPRAHGSGLFTRGQTQVLTIATLGTPREEQQLDSLSPEESKRYMHHYNFPPYSVGETRPLRGTSRREIGHGALAERALLPVLPPEDEFPYTIRLVSEVLSSNGSTSMASVCGSTLALMDTGVPIKAPVSGVAMGLIKEGDNYRILTDIQGLEDFMGDMDFKVAGTRQGITALQMDIKIKGISYEIMAEALAQAHEARLFILDRMHEAMPEVRPELSPYAPRITIVHIDPEKIGTVIGPGGKVIRRIQEETGVKIDIEEDGSVYIASTDGPSAKRAQAMIESLVEEAQIGKIYTGKVVRTTDFGAFVEILPGQDGMVHISQLADYHVPSVEDVVHVGDEIMVMVTDIDSEGKIRLSRQAVLEGWTPEEAREHDRVNRSRRSGSGGRRRPEGRGKGDHNRRPRRR